MSRAVITTIAELAMVAWPTLVGFLAGRHLRARRLDQAERDAWHDGFAEGLHAVHQALHHHDPLDDVADQLDAAVEQAPHPSDNPWWN